MARDLRRYARQTQVRLIAGGLFLLFILGEGLILLFYGPQAAASGLICMLLGMAPLVLIWLALVGIEWIVRHNAS